MRAAAWVLPNGHLLGKGTEKNDQHTQGGCGAGMCVSHKKKKKMVRILSDGQSQLKQPMLPEPPGTFR